MRYDPPLYRPPSEADALILQATLGCSWNHCTYCDMYRTKGYRVRALAECLDDLALAGVRLGARVTKLFVADGDALGMPMEHWRAILAAARRYFPRLRRVSCYATARNLLARSAEELSELSAAGLSLLYIGPESGDDLTLKRIAKGASFADHVAAADKAHAAGLRLSLIALLGAGGVARSEVHARKTAELVTAMDPAFFAALTLTIVPGTPIDALARRGDFALPDPKTLLIELRTMVDLARPSRALFRTNHASNYLPLAGHLPDDRERIVGLIDAALGGRIPLRPEWSRGL